MLRHCSRRARTCAAALAIALATGACGIKGPLTPAPKPAPEAAKDPAKAPAAASK